MQTTGLLSFYLRSECSGPGGTYDVSGSFERTQEVSKGVRHGNGNVGKRYIDLLIEPRARSTPGEHTTAVFTYRAMLDSASLCLNAKPRVAEQRLQTCCTWTPTTA